MSDVLLQAARQFHSFGLNVVPVTGKVPNAPGWKTWQTERIPAPYVPIYPQPFYVIPSTGDPIPGEYPKITC